jgi:serine/threonine-protein kinase RsbT
MSELTYSGKYGVTACDYAAAGEISANIKQVLKKIGFEPQLIRRVSIAAYEAELNMVIHSLGGEMTLFIYPDVIRITCADRGPGIADISLAMTEGYSTAPESVRMMGFGAGMGLPNIKKNADLFRIESNPSGTILEMEFNI